MLARPAMGFCFLTGADEDTRLRATSLETLRHIVAANSVITLLRSLAVPKERKRDGVCYFNATNQSPNVLSRWCIRLVYRYARIMRN